MKQCEHRFRRWNRNCEGGVVEGDGDSGVSTVRSRGGRFEHVDDVDSEVLPDSLRTTTFKMSICPHMTSYWASLPFERTNIYYMCLGKPDGPWRPPGPKFAPEAALRCQALPLSKRRSLWSGWVGQKRVSGWILRDRETGRDDGGNRRENGLFIPFSPRNLLVP